jgi:hypothetical protein
MQSKPNRLAAAAFSLVLPILAFAGCHKRVPAAPLPPVAAAPAPSVPSASALDQADRAFASGSYDEAARGYDDYLHLPIPGNQRDQALFRLGLTYALRPGPAADWQRATATFKQLLDEFPNSPFKPPANLILSLHYELDQLNADSKQRDLRIKQLSAELDRLKKVDADRRKRP